MRTAKGKIFTVPKGDFMYVKKHPEVDGWNVTSAGLVGNFKQKGEYLIWESKGGNHTIGINVQEIKEKANNILWVVHSAGIEFWFRRIV